jgi:hypothetical protein
MSIWKPTYDIIHTKLFPKVRRRIAIPTVATAVKMFSPIFAPKPRVFNHDKLMKVGTIYLVMLFLFFIHFIFVIFVYLFIYYCYFFFSFISL